MNKKEKIKQRLEEVTHELAYNNSRVYPKKS
jgi:hypothetical protein